MEHLVPCRPARRPRSPADEQARRWLDLASSVAPACDCWDCRFDEADRVAQAFDRCAGRDLAVLRAVADRVLRGGIESPGAEHVATAAFARLLHLGDDEDVERLVERQIIEDDSTPLYTALTDALASAPADRVIPLLRETLEQDTDLLVRRAVLDALGARQDGVPEVLDILTDELRVDPHYAALVLRRYGDTGALPALHATLGRASVAPSTPPDHHRATFAVARTIERLGGVLDHAETHLLRSIARRRNRCDCGECGAREPARAEPRTRPNAPCPCGSGRKYKKCCA